jgi:hypothetical protein
MVSMVLGLNSPISIEANGMLPRLNKNTHSSGPVHIISYTTTVKPTFR